MLSIVLFFASCIVVSHSQVAWSTASSAPSGPWLKYGEGFFMSPPLFWGEIIRSSPARDERSLFYRSGIVGNFSNRG